MFDCLKYLLLFITSVISYHQICKTFTALRGSRSCQCFLLNLKNLVVGNPKSINLTVLTESNL